MKSLVKAHTLPLHYLVGGKWFSASKKSKNNSKIITWSPWYLYSHGHHVKRFLMYISEYFEKIQLFLFVMAKINFYFQRDIIQTAVQFLHKQNFSYFFVRSFKYRNIFETAYCANIKPISIYFFVNKANRPHSNYKHP